MAPFRHALWLSLTFLMPASASAGFLDFIFPKRDIEVITVTDTTKVGALRRPATAANPVYFVAINAGHRDLGGIIAGDKLPKESDVNRTIVKVLAKQGYLPATRQNPPSILLLWTWGTMNTERDITFDGSEGQQINHRQLLRFLGGYKLGMISKDPRDWQMDPLGGGLMLMDADASNLYDLASEDLYVAAIAAYDYGAVQRREKVLLWTTKISCPALGLALADTLPTMLAIAGPNIGRETMRPVWVKATDKYKPEVRVGEPVVVPDEAPLPIFDAPKPNGKTPTAAPPQKRRK